MNGYELISKIADESREEMVARRRDFHKHAETGWFEMRTSSIIAGILTDLGYSIGRCGITWRNLQPTLHIWWTWTW